MIAASACRDRPLERRSCSLAERVAARRELWRPHLDHERHRAHLRGAAPRRRRRPVGDLLAARQRHGLARPRHLQRRGARRRRARSRSTRCCSARPERRTPPRRRRDVLVRAVAHPPPDLRGGARGLDPRLLAAALAPRPVHGRRRGRAAPPVGLLRRRAAPARAARSGVRRQSADSERGSAGSRAAARSGVPGRSRGPRTPARSPRRIAGARSATSHSSASTVRRCDTAWRACRAACQAKLACSSRPREMVDGAEHRGRGHGAQPRERVGGEVLGDQHAGAAGRVDRQERRQAAERRATSGA